MRRFGVTACVVAVCVLAAPKVSADPVLWEAGFYQDGDVYTLDVDTIPATWDLSLFDTVTGLGSITAQVTGLGVHTLLAFLDIELDEEVGGFSDEFGGVVGAAPGGLRWEIDEPGLGGMLGDIYDNFEAGALDGTNAFAGGAIDDVSIALGWAVLLAADETATLTLTIGTVAPVAGFYLVQTDATSGSSVYFSTSASITGGGGPTGVPEPATLLLMGLGLILGARRISRH